jgi:hypothetical protein
MRIDALNRDLRSLERETNAYAKAPPERIEEHGVRRIHVAVRRDRRIPGRALSGCVALSFPEPMQRVSNVEVNRPFA